LLRDAHIFNLLWQEVSVKAHLVEKALQDDENPAPAAESHAITTAVDKSVLLKNRSCFDSKVSGKNRGISRL
jgi:hypothetical protein